MLSSLTFSSLGETFTAVGCGVCISPNDADRVTVLTRFVPAYFIVLVSFSQRLSPHLYGRFASLTLQSCHLYSRRLLRFHRAEVDFARHLLKESASLDIA